MNKRSNWLILLSLLLLWGCSGSLLEPTSVAEQQKPATQSEPTSTTEATTPTVNIPTSGPTATDTPATPAPSEASVAEAATTVPPTDTPIPEPTSAPAVEGADIIAVAASGSSGAYSFSVSIASPDTGCDQFADWWEVLSEEGELLYRRVLLHSHVGEQPFTRSGGPVAIEADQVVWVRAHMSTSGYGGATFKGSAATSFQAAALAADFALEAARLEPLPTGCAF